MAGNRAGGLKAAAKNRLKYGEDFYSKIGADGGKKTHELGHLDKVNFKAHPERARKAGAVGGRKSKPYSVNPKNEA